MTTYMAEECDVVGLDWLCGLCYVGFSEKLKLSNVELSVTMTEGRHTVGPLNTAQKPATNDIWCWTQRYSKLTDLFFIYVIRCTKYNWNEMKPT